MRRICGLVALTLIMAGLGLADQKNHHSDVFMPGPQEAPQLAKNVRHALLMLPYYSIFDDLYFQIDGTVVTLEGACPPEPPWNIKSDAEDAVKRVEGVTQVVNNIKLLPMSNTDWQIRRAMVKAIYGDPDIGMRYGYQALPTIHIIVDNGHVTLDGVVDNQFDDTLIRTRANSVPNVFSVTDNLEVLNRGKKKPA